MRLVGWLHVGLFRLLLWAARFLGRSLWNTVGAFLALLGEEVRRYLGLLLWAVVIWLAGKATMNYAPPATKTPLVLVLLGLVVIWGLAVVRATRFTRQNNLIRVRQRQAFRDLQADVQGTRRDMLAGLARRTRGTPAGGVFRSNREASRQEAADAQEAADRAEREAAEAARARAERDRWAEQAGAEHDPFVKQGS